MRLIHPIVLLGAALAVSQFTTAGLSSGIRSQSLLTPHQNNAPKPIIKRFKSPSVPAKYGFAPATEVTDIEAFLRKGGDGMPRAALIKQLKFDKKVHSLTADHYVFTQHKGDIAIDGSKLIVSVDAKTGQIFRLYSQLIDGKSVKTAKNLIDAEDAYDYAWRDLWINGKLLAAPQIKLTYKKYGKKLIAVYKTFLHTSSPAGAWETIIDAGSGRILSHRDTRLFTKPRPASYASHKKFGKLTNRKQAFARYAISDMPVVRKAQNFYNSEEFTGWVYDPDPRTSSGNNELRNTSPAEAFANEYRKVVLKDLSTNANGDFVLQGPWVSIIDFESPSDPAPSSSPSGQWSARRDSKAFGEVMVYHHIDQNQRYMQSLFNNNPDRRIQFKAIEADANGVNGEDNSHFIPSSNRLAFGHGCVPDPEDTDVVLHEYGHAIQHDINPNWDGGDTGAMGEGFGDYWAGSYSLAAILKKNVNAPMDHFVTNVFNWDGHGGGECWDGRKLTNKDVVYDPSRTYGAHGSIPNGVTDELWSAPLFLSLLDVVGEHTTLEDKLEARRMMDTIILESHFGLGGNLTMRMMGEATIDAAIKLSGENSPHTQALTKWFQFFKITENPEVRLTLADITLNASTIGDNGAVDPGEVIGFGLEIANMGRNGADVIDGTVNSGTATATMYETYATYGAVGGRGSAKSSNDYTLAVSPDHTCGEPIIFNMSMDYQENDEWKNIQVPFSISTGIAQTGVVEDAPGAAIPDADPTGITTSLSLNSDEGVVDENFTVSVNITHTYSSDLTLTLISPSGKSIILRKEEGGSADDVITTYPTESKPLESFTALYGEPLKGDWQLKVTDSAKDDRGTLNSWAIKYVSSFVCAQRK